MSIVYSENMTMMPTRLVASTCIRLTGQELQEGERFLGILRHHLLTATPRPGRSAQGSVMPTTELHQAVGTVDTPLLHHLLHKRVHRSASNRDHYHHPSPDQWYGSSPTSSYHGRYEPRHPSTSAAGGRVDRRSLGRFSYRPSSREREQHVSFSDTDIIHQGNGQ